MYREYSEKEMLEIMKQDVKIPDSVEKKIQDAYRQIGEEKVTVVRHKKTPKLWKVVAAAAVLTVGTSTVVLAANYILSVNRMESGEDMVYDISVDRELEAHAVEVEPTYMPEGYVYQEEGAFGGKWRNEETDSTLTILAYNAAELDWMDRIGQDVGFRGYKKDTELEEVTIGDQKVDVYTGEDFYVDSDDTVKQLYLFNEEYGYGIWITNRSTLESEELVKIAEGLEIKVSDEVVPYATEAEVEEELMKAKSSADEMDAWHGRKVAAEDVHSIGEEVVSPLYDLEAFLDFQEEEEITGDYVVDDIRFTVKSAEFREAVSFEEFPAENFEIYEQIAPWLNEDGTLKPHERTSEGSNDEAETVNAKFLVVEMNATNAGDTQNEANINSGISIAPDLTTLIPNTDGTYSPRTEYYYSVNEGYELQYSSNGGSSFPIYFDKQYYTEGTQGLKHGLYRPIASGESLDYTLIYVIDEDQTDNACLCFSSGTVGGDEAYVAIGKNVAK